MSEDQPKIKTQATLKKDKIVIGCPLCNTGFDEAVNTNEEIHCPACEQDFIARKV